MDSSDKEPDYGEDVLGYTMSEQPQELQNVHIEHWFPKGYNPDDEPWKSIKAHHNAALAAENEARMQAEQIAASAMLEVTQLRNQLAAEQEVRKPLVDALEQITKLYGQVKAKRIASDALAKESK